MASRGVNKVILVGNLGQDPEIRYMPNGNAVANITLATSDSYKDKNTDQMVDKTEWHRIVFFGKLAEIVGEYCRKGSQIYVEGKLQTRKWADQQGQDRYTTEVVVDINGQMQMLGGKSNEQGAVNQQSNNQGVQQQSQQQGGFAPQQNQQQGGFNQQQQGGFAPQQQGVQQGGFAPQQGGFNPNGGNAQ